MTIATYISDLLYRYDCVIVPNFGGFVTNPISAQLVKSSNTFYPPSKRLTFNMHLQNNDGLLANYIASVKNISFLKAMEIINAEVVKWNATLQTDVLELEKIGSIQVNTFGKMQFEPNASTNYLTSSFGMSSLASPVISRIAYKEKFRDLETIAPILHSEENKSKLPSFIKYAASVAILFALGTFSWNEFNALQHNNLVEKAALEQQKVEKTIQEATFVIENPLPTITLTVEQSNKFHIIAGAFRTPENADTKLKELVENGFNAKIVGVNKWGLTQVAYESLPSEEEAVKRLNFIINNVSEDAWLLIEK